MFEIGRNLREARVRRGLELAEIAAATRIRRRYLQALEDERFELLPGMAYARGFLRTYAEFLELDGQLFVDEYNARFAAEEILPAPPQLPLRPRPLWPYGIGATALLIALAGGLVAWQLGGSSSPRESAKTVVTEAAGPPATEAPRPSPTPRRTRPAPKAAAPTLVLHAVNGPCWLSVRRQGGQGRYLFEGTLESGQSRRFANGPLWIRVGAPWNLEASLGGRPLPLPKTVADVLVTHVGIRTLATG